MKRIFTLVVVAAAACSAAGAAERPLLYLPYDLEVRGGSVYVADALRHQIMRYELHGGRVSVFAGTGEPGTSGDGGPAVHARLAEPTELDFDRAGNLYFTDVNQERVRRIDRSGTITTLARVRAAAGLSVDPTGRYLAVASIQNVVYRLRLPRGRLERLAGDGTEASSGDGGAAAKARVNGPHDVTYDASGNLLIAERGRLRRIDARTGRISTLLVRPASKTVLGQDGTLYLLAGSPAGGTITHVDATGKVLLTIGTGGLSNPVDRAPVAKVGLLPSDVEPIKGGILITQTEPFPAVRRLDTGSRTLTTFTR